MKPNSIRSILILTSMLTALSAPAAVMAREAPEQKVLQQLNDPAFQERMAGMMAGLMRAMMVLPVGEIAASMEQVIPPEMRDPEDDRSAPDIDRNATLGDMLARDNPDFVEDIEGQTRNMTKMMGGMAGQFAGMLPEFRAMAEKMKRQMEGSLTKD